MQKYYDIARLRAHPVHFALFWSSRENTFMLKRIIVVTVHLLFSTDLEVALSTTAVVFLLVLWREAQYVAL